MRIKAYRIPVALFQTLFLVIPLLAEQTDISKLSDVAVIEKIQRLQIPFIANTGQTDERIKFYATTFGGSVFITKDGEIVYSLPKIERSSPTKTFYQGCGMDRTMPLQEADTEGYPYPTPFRFHISPSNSLSSLMEEGNSGAIKNTSHLTLKEEITGGKNIETIEGEGEIQTKINYFKGTDPSKWKDNIPVYEFVNLGEVYEGIKLKLRAYGNNVEKLFYINPDADTGAIKIKLSGALALRVNEMGQLEAETTLGTVTFTKPVAYQDIDGERVNVDVEYCILKSEHRSQNGETNLLNPKSEFQNPNSEIENVYGFNIASYDKTKYLIIDPLLASTYLGGIESDYGNSIVIDTGKNIFVAGYTESSGFPTTTGAYDTSYHNGDVFVSKFNGDLTRLLASTFLGGASSDYVRSIAIDLSNNVYVAGQTSSLDFPTTDGAYDASKSGYSDAFVAKLSGDLTHLIASTFLGGSSDDYVYSVCLDQNGISICVTGRTLSPNFPTTPDAFDTIYENGDAFVSKLSWNLTRLIASTFLGGTNNDYGNSVVIDSNRNIYVGGDTWSPDFPVSVDAYDSSFNGGFGDVFVSKLNWDLTRLLASTFLGGATDESVSSIAIDPRGNIYVVGQTESLDFPTSPAAYDTSFHNGDVFLSKLNGNLTKLLASTFFGGADDDVGNALAIGSDGNIYVAGHTASSDFPTTRGSYNTSKRVFFDAFVSKFSADLTSLIASTFLGGNYRDIARSFALDSDNNIYVTGETRSSNFPTTSGAYDISYNGDVNTSYTYDAFVLKLNNSLSASPLMNNKK